MTKTKPKSKKKPTDETEPASGGFVRGMRIEIEQGDIPAIMAALEAELPKESDIPLSGGLLKAIVSNFTMPPIGGDDGWEFNSVGLAQNSVVATDSYSAIQLGEDRNDHVATSRKETLLEAERAKLYGDPVRLDEIERNVDPKTNEAKPMPQVRGIINKGLAGMKGLAVVSPDALIAVGKVAVAAGAIAVELFQKEGDASALGFQFTFSPQAGHINLFSTWEGPITARGVFKAEKSLSVLHSEADGEVEAVSQRKRGKSGTAVKADEAEPIAASVAVPAEPVDLAYSEQRGTFALPGLSVLSAVEAIAVDSGGYEGGIVEVLRQNNIPGRIVATSTGPTVTLYELEVPAGNALTRVARMGDQLQMQLAVKSVRIQAPIPGKKAIGIEIPNKTPRMVSMLDMCATRSFVDSTSRLLMALGQDTGGRPVFADLTTMPHLLVAGATNSGKSIGIAAMLCSLLLRNTPDELRLVLIDPKQVELSLFEELPHLMCPVVTDVKESAGVLRAVVREMERRYSLCKKAGARNITSYLEKPEAVKMPFVVVVIDELADLIMQCPEVQDSIVRLGQKARAVGIHLIVATQRPSADIVTGLIKANIPSRIAFAVATQIDSRVILDTGGAETLLGKGDMLFSPLDAGGKTTRVQGAYVSESDVEAVCKYWRGVSGPAYDLVTGDEHVATEEGAETDPLYLKAVDHVRSVGEASTSMLQRKFGIGFLRAGQLINQMEEAGVIGPLGPDKKRMVLKAKDGE